MSSSTSNSESGTARAKRFLLLFAVGLVLVESGFALFATVSRGRHEVDEIAALADAGSPRGEVLVLSDSVSYGVLDLAGDTAGIIDFTSNHIISVAGNAFLVRRYLERAERAPAAVLFVTSPVSLHSNLDSKTMLDLYFTSVFTREAEIADVESKLDRPDLVEAMRAARRSLRWSFPSHLRRGHISSRLDRALRRLQVRLLGTPSGAPPPHGAEARAKIERDAARTRFDPVQPTVVFLEELALETARHGTRLVLMPCPMVSEVEESWRANGFWEEYLAWMSAFAERHENVEFRGEIPIDAGDDRRFYDGVHLRPSLKREWGERLAEIARGLTSP